MTDVRILQTKKRLADALLALAKDTPVDDISIVDLCKKADVNRSTFYKYYRIPSDILTELCLDMLAHTLDKYTQANDTGYSYERFMHRLIDMLTWYDQNKAITVYVFENGGFAHINNSLASFHSKLPQTSYSFYYMVGGITNLIYRWCKEDDGKTPEEMAKIIGTEILKTREQDKDK